MKKKTVRDFDLKGKRVLVRVDFNVPLDKELRITDDNRIKASLPTIQYALDKGAKVVLMSHLGRPDGKRVSSMSLSPAAIRLAELLKQEVLQCSDCVGPTVQEELKKLDQNGVRVALLENLRFYPEEEKNDPGFAKQLSQNGEFYVNDAFGSSHRAHASIDGVTKFLPAGAGFLLEKEIEYLGEAVQHPQKPFVAILGGSKVSDKIGVIENLIDKVDKIIIGGAMAYTFMKAKGMNIGRSRFEKDKLDLARQILEKGAAKKVAILIPVDNIAVERFDEKAPTRVVENGIPDGWEGVDIGPKTAKLFRDALDDAKTVVWNGPMGVFEMKPFAKGSLEVAEKLAEITAKGAVTVIGGGDTAACVIGFGINSKMTHISTGGGASLEYLEGKCLPGIAALQDK